MVVKDNATMNVGQE